MAGWFYMLTPDPEVNLAYLEKHEVNVFKAAFQTPAEDVTYQPSLATAPATMDQWLLLRANKPNSPETQLALHHRLLVHDRWNAVLENQALERGTSFPELLNIIGLAHLSIRHANNALRKDPNAVPAYHALADSCGQLARLEEQISQILGGTVQGNQQRRYFQSVVAYNQAITAAPDQAYLHMELGNLYNRNNRLDLALREFNRFLEISGPPQGDDEAAQAEYERRLRIKKDLENKVELVQTEVDKLLENKVPGPQLAPLAMRNGCVLMGLELLKQDGQLPPHEAGVLISQLEAGFVEEAYYGLLQLEGQLDAQIKTAQVKQFGLAANPQVRHAIAMGALSVGDYDKAVEQWTKQAEESEQRAMLMLMGTLPMVNRPVDPVPLFMQLADDSPLTTWLTGRGFLEQMAPDTAAPLWNAALCQLEAGRPKVAADLLKKLLEIHPESAYRPLAVFYIELTTRESYDRDPPSFQVPVWEGMFASGPAVAEKPKREGVKPMP
jgi:tetratricopeptide (TPR) repeat protein